MSSLSAARDAELVDITMRDTIAPILAAICLTLIACGEEGLIDPHGEIDALGPSTEGLLAADFPTNNGFAWTYVNAETGQEFTLRIEGTRDIGGFTHRQMTISEIRPQNPDRINRDVVDHLAANALYFRIDSDFFEFPLPIFATYFLKTPQGYTESAFDAYIPGFDNPIIHQKHFPERRIWDFPLRVGKRWTVVEKTTQTSRTVVRRVLEENVPVAVPAGRYQAFLVEEEIVGLSQTEAFQPVGNPPQLEPARYEPAKYWVAPNVGVVKYQYDFLIQTTTPSQETINVRRSTTFELQNAELPGADE